MDSTIRTAAAGTCTATAVLFTAMEVTGAADPVLMPTTPHVVTAGAAAAGGLALLWQRRTGAFRGPGALAAASAALLATGCVAAVPHTVLILVVWAGALVTGGRGSFDVAPAWTATAANLAGVLAL